MQGQLYYLYVIICKLLGFFLFHNTRKIYFLLFQCFRLWCICKQPHNNRFMICCDGCEDWFHGKCVNITKAMGQQMEEQGIEWRCPNCVKKAKPQPRKLQVSKCVQPHYL